MPLTWEFSASAILLAAAVSPLSGQIPPQRFLALGDSYTIGEGVQAAERWPVQLAAVLRGGGIAVADPEIIARTGWTTDELDRAITAASPQGPFALVTLLIGVNNQYRCRTVDEYRAQFRALLVQAVGFAGSDAMRVIVVSIPDWGVTPFNTTRDAAQIARDIDAFNEAARDETTRTGAQWLDITDLTRAAPRDVVADGLHPSAAMYAKWAHRALPIAKKVVSP